MKIEIRSTANGFIVKTDESYVDGFKEYVYRSIDVFPMLEFVGFLIIDRKIVVKEK